MIFPSCSQSDSLRCFVVGVSNTIEASTSRCYPPFFFFFLFLIQSFYYIDILEKRIDVLTILCAFPLSELLLCCNLSLGFTRELTLLAMAALTRFFFLFAIIFQFDDN